MADGLDERIDKFNEKLRKAEYWIPWKDSWVNAHTPFQEAGEWLDNIPLHFFFDLNYMNQLDSAMSRYIELYMTLKKSSSHEKSMKISYYRIIRYLSLVLKKPHLIKQTPPDPCSLYLQHSCLPGP